jgi:hypothetical protein
MKRNVNLFRAREIAGWLFAPRTREPGFLWPRWLFLRALGLIFLSAFHSLAFQIHGLIGPEGILPAKDYLALVARVIHGPSRYAYAPTLLWMGSGDVALTALVTVGAVASVLVTLNIWPRLGIAVAWLAFLSFIGAAQDFASYQSDGMLLEAGFLALFFAPPGFRPGLGRYRPPSRASLFLLQWEWFRIYFESGVVKLASGDASWRDMTAMDHYYENGPLPTWVGWYVQHWSHGFHATTAFVTLVVELVVCWMVFLPRGYRLGCFFVVTALQVGIIATANYAFLNYLVLVLGVLLLDDGWIARLRIPGTTRAIAAAPATSSHGLVRGPPLWRLILPGLPLTLLFYSTIAIFLFNGAPPPFRWLLWPAEAIEPFRIANRYGLFAVMTPARYEIEFQGSRDGQTWKTYAFRYKPQDPRIAPGIYAPYQPRFEWNLWFASLGSWRQYTWVVRTEARLLEGSKDVLSLFAKDPFDGTPPSQVRAVAWQYWFTSTETHRATGEWWRREEIGPYCPPLARGADGSIEMVQGPRYQNEDE